MTETKLDYGAVEIVMTAEKDWTGTENELQQAFIAGIPIENFEGGVKKPVSVLTELVPEGLSMSSKPKMIEEEYEAVVMDEEGVESTETRTRMVQEVIDDEPQYEQKTWEEFAITNEAEDGEILLSAFHYINESKCHTVITSEELYIWAEALGRTNFHTKSAFREMRKIATEV